MGTREFTRVPKRTCLRSSAVTHPEMTADLIRAAAHHPPNRVEKPKRLGARIGDSFDWRRPPLASVGQTSFENGNQAKALH